jgi:hypothetical protein
MTESGVGGGFGTIFMTSGFNARGRGERPTDDAASMYRRRAEECLAAALEAQDEAHRTAAVEMALYWFEVAEQRKKDGDGGLIARRESGAQP